MSARRPRGAGAKDPLVLAIRFELAHLADDGPLYADGQPSPEISEILVDRGWASWRGDGGLEITADGRLEDLQRQIEEGLENAD